VPGETVELTTENSNALFIRTTPVWDMIEKTTAKKTKFKLNRDMLKNNSEIYGHTNKIIDITVVEVYDPNLSEGAPSVIIKMSHSGDMRNEKITEINPSSEIKVDKATTPVEISFSKDNFKNYATVDTFKYNCSWI
jgi:hypothetical protein